MRAMKDSGIEWIGEIPADWTICKIKHFVVNEDGVRIGPFGSALTNRLLENGEYNVYSQANLIASDFASTKHTIDEETFNDLRSYEVLADDICVSMMGTIGKCMVVPNGIKPGIMDSHLIKIRLTPRVNPKFFEYVYDKDNSGLCFVQMKRDSKGTIMDGLNSTIVKNLFFPLPSHDIQNIIVDYLDKKCAEIDAIIAAKEKTNELLKERRQSIIYEAVTKGLDPTVPMKDSGIEWIGEIPSTWKIRKLRYLGSCANGISKAGEFFGSGSPFVSYGDVYKNMELPREVAGLIETTAEEQQLYSVEEGDVFFTRTSETIEEVAISSTCMQTIENATFAGFLIRFRPNTELLTKEFSKYYFRSEMHRFFFVKEMNLVTRASLSQDLLKKLPVLLPPVEEQKRIASYLDNECSNIDGLIATNESTIEKLKEYRQSVIYEAVTGKIEI